MIDDNATILVLGLGNTLLTDEAVGVRVAEYLVGHPESREVGLRPMDGGTMGLTLLVEMEDAEALIIVDAAFLNKEPGAIEVFEGLEMDHFLRNRGRSPHDIGLDDLMDGLRLRQAVPDHRALVGIQPEVLTVGENLTHAVAAAMSAASDEIIAIARRWREENRA
ncbi:MAG: hydrogenase maturation protease [Rhodobacteraceae bacterium]|nr:hydrogenase maturation protease [Paracoccaceae bacterium]